MDSGGASRTELREEERQARDWAMYLHRSVFAGFVLPVVGFAVPIMMWRMKRKELPATDVHGKIVLNWIVSLLIYGVICVVLMYLLIGTFLFLGLVAVSVIYAIVGAIKANSGEVWQYPMSLDLVK